MLNRLPEALEDCRSAMTRDRGYVKAYTRAARYHLQRAEMEQAHDCLQDLSPESLTEEESAEIEKIDAEIRELHADMSKLEQVRSEFRPVRTTCRTVLKLSVLAKLQLMAAGDGPAAESLLAKAPLAPLLSNQVNCPRLRAGTVSWWHLLAVCFVVRLVECVAGRFSRHLLCCFVAVKVGAKLLCGRDAEALHESRMWIAEKPADGAELAWTTLGRCHLWMCNVDDVAKLPMQNTHVTAAATVVRLATIARECKSRGNAQFQAGDYSAAEKSYSDGTPRAATHLFPQSVSVHCEKKSNRTKVQRY